MQNEKGFFAVIREHLGTLNQMQVQGFQALMAQWTASLYTNQHWFAYMLATAWHETAHTMQPITEIGKGKGHAYGLPDPITKQRYYGRGYIQLTWKKNYEHYGIALDPDKALDPNFAAKIMLDGMVHGTFTGKKLSDYFNATKNDALNARRIINGTDKASLIAGYYNVFVAAIDELNKVEAKAS